MAKQSGEVESLVDINKLHGFYKHKRVFITGHTGFKGAWLASWLHLAGASIKGYALPPDYERSLFELLAPSDFFETVLADIRDRDRLFKELRSFQPDFVFHLAAQPLVRRSYEIPAETFEVNVSGTANLLEAIKNIDRKCTVVVITTDKVYENIEDGVLLSEDAPLGGHDPYSTSKACAELVVDCFRKSFFQTNDSGMPQKSVSTARAGNVIGGGDWSKDRIIPDVVRALESEVEVEVRNPLSIRPWQHVLEPLCGYLQLAMLMDQFPLRYTGAYNFGPLPEDHLTVGELVEKAIVLWGSGSWKNVSNPHQLHEAGVLKLDISRAIKNLEWKPKLNAQTALKWTIDWFKQPEEKKAQFTFQQIKDYQAL